MGGGCSLLCSRHTTCFGPCCSATKHEPWRWTFLLPPTALRAEWEQSEDFVSERSGLSLAEARPSCQDRNPRLASLVKQVSGPRKRHRWGERGLRRAS